MVLWVGFKIPDSSHSLPCPALLSPILFLAHLCCTANSISNSNEHSLLGEIDFTSLHNMQHSYVCVLE